MAVVTTGIAALGERLAAGATIEEIVRDAFARIAESPDRAVWISLRPLDDVLREAEALERERSGGAVDRPLLGIPFAVKDNIDVAGLPTSAGCEPFAYRPSRDAAVVARLRAAGALPIGKTNLDQFATGLVGTRSPFGAPRSVFSAAHVSGGSSSGSAVAVARGEVAFALGTDTAGSGRVPAAFNHVVGVKPTRGLLSTRGVVPACRSLDCVSVFARSCADADRVRRIAQAFDPEDGYARPAVRRPLPRPGLVLGVLAEVDRDFAGDGDSARLYGRAIDRVASAGFTVRAIDWAPFREAAALLYGPWVAERLADLEDALGRFRDAVDPTVREIVEGGRRHSAVDLFRAQHELARLARRAVAQWDEVDALLLPTAPTIHRIDEVRADPIGSNAKLGRYTNFVNLLDCCAVAVPAGFRHDGLPFGVTLIAPGFCDDDLALLADRVHRRLEPTSGLSREAVPDETPAGAGDDPGVAVAVVGAHLSGEPLNHELTDRGARLIARTRTSAAYRLYALPGTTPPKPGLLHDPDAAGPGIEVEVWSLSRESFGDLVAGVPQPLAVGTIELAGGERVKGFLCEASGVRGAAEITSYGGWRGYRAAHRGG